MRDLSEIRVDIDRVDNEIKSLYQERLSLAFEVAQYKIANNKQVFDPKREAEKLDTLTCDIEDKDIKTGIRELFQRLMADSRRLQHGLVAKEEKEPFGYAPISELSIKNPKVVHQGEPGAYSEAAAREFFKNVKLLENVPTFREAMEKVSKGDCDYCVLPIENSTAGSVTEIYDLLVEYDLSIIGEQVIAIDHMLLGVKGSTLSHIKTICSHPQALSQCSEFIENLPGVEKQEMVNTALAAKWVSLERDKSIAAIGSAINAKLYDLEILEKSIQNINDNKTRFVVLSKNKLFLKNAKKLSISFILKHEKGALYDALAHLSYSGINLSFIESRPTKNTAWEYRFFVDLEASLMEPHVVGALMRLKESTTDMRILGNY